ncbi:uncharacterized protein BJ171DRAFT_457247 [Polychytrium aggregatum]|uniref:uncharacterized protein n=1 Tax=Polychytrium aggregatum TaxID=110093 RepID=UPI0022FF0C77|nr:uncharacterized protein BJ171DRAFT_457247 [Polychytrium aggregatum]KAI9206777.1 hypothetical protein BJ171DRAFT_457247 [Polychytrium aggregatum]
MTEVASATSEAPGGVDTTGCVDWGTVAKSNDSILDYFKTNMGHRTTDFYSALRADCERIEESMKTSEHEVLRKEEDAYLEQRNNAEEAHLKQLHQEEINYYKARFQSFLASRDARKKAKKLQRQTIRDMKRRDILIAEQESASKEEERIKSTQTEKRVAFDRLIAFLNNKHDKQRRQLLAAQERKIQYERVLDEMMHSHEKVEVRRSMEKKSLARINHQIAANKRVADQLQEVQQLELQQLKEKFDLDFETLETVQNMKITHAKLVAEATSSNLSEINQEKEKIISLKEKLKLERLELEHAGSMQTLLHRHIAELRQLREAQNMSSIGLAKKGDNSFLGSNLSLVHSVASKNDSNLDLSPPPKGDTASERGEPVRLSKTSFRREKSTTSRSGKDRVNSIQSQERDSVTSEEEDRRIQLKVDGSTLERLRVKHSNALSILYDAQKAEIEEVQVNMDKRKRELEASHAIEMRELVESHNSEIETLYSNQEKEIQMEASVHEAEARMLVERKVLYSVVDSVISGIITIDPIGTITRFNRAAEQMFGYQASEVIGKNIKMLQPHEIAVQHDFFLSRYLETGVRRIIGHGRKAEGVKKNGSRFPVHISVSEVLEEGIHLFTGIVRDLTDMVEYENKQAHIALQKQEQIKLLLWELDETKKRSDVLLAEVMPPSISKTLSSGKPPTPEQFSSATILFSSIVGFSEMYISTTPTEIVELLNLVYSTLDEVISMHNVYKVDSVQGCYIVASGLDSQNSGDHAAEIASLALSFLSVVNQLSIPTRNDMRLKIQLGIHTGPVMAGVVGTARPRYRLFGQTLQTASRLMDSGLPMRVQVSEDTYKQLSQSGGFKLAKRGETVVRGEDATTTYWLVGKENSSEPLPEETTSLLSE